MQQFANTEPQQGIFNYTGGDLIVDLANSTGKNYIRCHNLICPPPPPPPPPQGTWTNATLTAVMQRHIYSLILHFGANCYSWDVVNEALNSDGTFVPNIWYNTIGHEYFFLAFKFAAEAVALTDGDDIQLYYNDYGIESPNAKTAAAAALVAELQYRGIQIDGVALESHFEVGAMPNKTRQIAAMESFTSLGVDVVRSEIDIRFTSLPYTAIDLQTQKQNYYDTIASCMAVENCIGMTVWDFADVTSWVPAWSNYTEGGADLYDENFVRKPAYEGVADAIMAGSMATSSSSTTAAPALPTSTLYHGIRTNWSNLSPYANY
jgi:endo-1,4-beta-xylanase